MARPSDFVTLVRIRSVELLDAIADLHTLKAEWDALDYGNTLGATGAFEGENATVNIAKVSAVMTKTLPALDALLIAGHASNLQKLR